MGGETGASPWGSRAETENGRRRPTDGPRLLFLRKGRRRAGDGIVRCSSSQKDALAPCRFRTRPERGRAHRSANHASRPHARIKGMTLAEALPRVSSSLTVLVFLPCLTLGG